MLLGAKADSIASKTEPQDFTVVGRGIVVDIWEQRDSYGNRFYIYQVETETHLYEFLGNGPLASRAGDITTFASNMHYRSPYRLAGDCSTAPERQIFGAAQVPAPAFRITELKKAECPAALEHFWSRHTQTHVSERYTKLLQQREYPLEWAEKIGLGFELPKPSSGLRGLRIPFRKTG